MAENGDMKAHEQTYHGFIGLLKWGTVASALVAALVWLISWLADAAREDRGP
jgi:hypothetical protein